MALSLEGCGEMAFRHDQGGREEEMIARGWGEKREGCISMGGWVRQKAPTPRSDSGRKSEGAFINHSSTEKPKS